MIHYYMGLWVDYIEWNLREIDMVVVYVWAILLLLQCLFWRKFLLSCWAVPPQKLLFFWLLLGQAAAIAVVLLLQNLFTIQDYLRAELQNITQCCLFLMLYAWIALNWAGRHAYSQPTYYYIYTYLLVFEWLLYFESIALDIKPNCMNSVLIILPLQDRNLSDSWANVGRFVYLSKYPYLLAVGCWQNAIKLILLARLHIFLLYYSYILYILTFF